MDQHHRPCPNCGASVPEHNGYISWCHCGWNLYPHRPKAAKNFTERISATYGDEIAHTLFESMQGGVPQRELTTSKALAYTLAALVHASSLLMVLLGVWLLATSWPNIFAILGAVLALSIGWVVRPRIRKPPEGMMLARAEYPELYALVDEVAELLEHKPIKGIVAEPSFNAFYATTSRGDSYLGLGLPLWRISSAQERVGLLGHELGHGVNGDVQRGVFIGTAIDTLIVWHNLLRPNSIFDNELGGPGLLMIPFNILMLGMAQLSYATAWMLLVLMRRDSQRAEYLADYLASTVAGSESTLSLLEKFHYGDTFNLAMQRSAVRNDSPFFATLDTLMAEVPEREIERVRRVTLMKDSRIDTTHPPTALRYRFIESQPTVEPQLVLDPERSGRIESELANAYAQCERAVVNHYHSGLYY